MAMRATVASLDDVLEAHRGFYREQPDHTFALDLVGAEELPDIVPLRNAFERQRLEGADLQRKLDLLRARVPEDFSREEWARLKAVDAACDPDGTAQLDAVRAEHAAAMAERDAQIAKATSFIHRHMIATALRDALAAVGCRASLMKAAIALHSPACTTKKYGGELQAVAAVKYGHMPISKFIAQWAATTEGREFVETSQYREENDGSFVALIRSLR